MDLNKFSMYKDFRLLRKYIREDIIRVMPRAFKIPDAFFLKEHLAALLRLMAEAAFTKSPLEKKDCAEGMLYELCLLRDEVEQQAEQRTVSLTNATRIYSGDRLIKNARNMWLLRRLSKGISTVNSYLGLLKPYCTRKIRKEIASMCYKRYKGKVYFGRAYLKMVIKKKPKKCKKKVLQVIHQKD